MAWLSFFISQHEIWEPAPEKLLNQFRRVVSQFRVEEFHPLRLVDESNCIAYPCLVIGEDVESKIIKQARLITLFETHKHMVLLIRWTSGTRIHGILFNPGNFDLRARGPPMFI